MIKKYNEDELIREIAEYIDSTYGQHYVGADNIQLMDLIMADKYEEASGFLRYNAIKYLTRHCKKAGTARADLLKSVHYIVLLLSLFDKHNKADFSELTDIIPHANTATVNVTVNSPRFSVSKDWATQYGLSVTADPNVTIRN